MEAQMEKLSSAPAESKKTKTVSEETGVKKTENAGVPYLLASGNPVVDEFIKEFNAAILQGPAMGPLFLEAFIKGNELNMFAAQDTLFHERHKGVHATEWMYFVTGALIYCMANEQRVPVQVQQNIIIQANRRKYYAKEIHRAFEDIIDAHVLLTTPLKEDATQW